MKKVCMSLLFLSSLCLAQNPVFKLANLQQTATVQNDLKYTVDGIDGHQYLLDEWGTGIIIINDSINTVQARIQFDMVSGEPIIGNAHRAEKGFILRDKSITGFVINNTKFVRVPSSQFQEKMDRSYFVTPMFSKNNYLITNYSKYLKEPYVNNNGYNKTDLNKKYVTLKKYYFLNKDNKYVSLKLKKKEILKLLSDKENELKKYIKNQDLNLKDEKDVSNLLAFYHSL